MYSFYFSSLQLLGNLGKLRRAFVLVNENGRANTDILKTILLKVTNNEERTKRIEVAMKERELRDSVERFNIKPYFPATSLAIMEDFLSNNENNFKEKKEEFEVYLNSCSTLELDMDNFCAHLLKTLFRKDFIRDHRWPTTE